LKICPNGPVSPTVRVVTRLLHMRLGRLFYAVGFVFFAGLSTIRAAEDFNRNVRPILADNCFECHGPDQAARQADLRLDTRDGILRVVDGRPVVELLVERVTAADPEQRMPPAGAHRRPTSGQIATLRRWVAEGAVFQDHWAFVAPGRKGLPVVANDDWCRNGIDRFVRSKLDRKGWSPRPEASRETLIRRLSLDLRGLPPTPAAVERQIADKTDGAFEALVDRWLESPRYGEHMAWAWMEAARYSDTDGFQSDAERHMWRWRDWVIEAFNRNLPFDQFTIEQLAGDLLPNPTIDQILATGFNRNHRYDKGSGTIQAESVFENAADRMETTATVWLGLTVGCARCHDHKFDPISSREYYELLAFFDNVPENGQAILFNSHPRMKTPTRSQQERLAELDVKVAAAERHLAGLAQELELAQQRWERRVKPEDVKGEVVSRGLVDVFHLDGMESKGKTRNGRVKFVRGVQGRAMKFGDGPYFEFDQAVGNIWGRTEFTTSFWFKLDDLSDGVLMSELHDPDDLRTGSVIEIKDGRLRFLLSARWNYAVTWFEVKPRLQKGKWYHFAVSCDGQVQLLAYRIYLNGTKAPIRVIQDSAVDGQRKFVPLYLGHSSLWPSFKGALDELRFYNRVLSPIEVGALSVREPVWRLAQMAGERRSARQRDLLRLYFEEHVAAGKLAGARSRVLNAQRERKEFIKSVPTTMVMVEAADRQSHMRVKGQFDQLGEVVRPGIPKILPPFPEDLPRNRLGLARWLVDRRNPLMARVVVNRIWQQFFGTGFVDSPENFGTQTARPEQAELLDWLAAEFVRQDWDLKALVRLIVTSATYRQASSASPGMWLQDPRNQLLARGPRHRLSAAVIRDQALAVGGLLGAELGGPSVYPYQPTGLWKLTSNKAYQPSTGKDLYRRSLYTFWRRAIAPPTMFIFDAPDREFCNVGVKRTNTPLQALATLNEEGFVEAAKRFGKRMIQDGGETDRERLGFGFQCVAAREATQQELGLLMDSLWVYRQEAGSEEAAFAAVGNVLLNLDKTLTKE
jgi:hypothetical protein